MTVPGQEVSSYWYAAVRQYNFFKERDVLHANVNAGGWVYSLLRHHKLASMNLAAHSLVACTTVRTVMRHRIQ